MDCEVQCGCCLDYAQEILDEERGQRSRLRLVTSEAA
jgi:bacterioferritin-associated ferredoxin